MGKSYRYNRDYDNGGRDFQRKKQKKQQSQERRSNSRDTSGYDVMIAPGYDYDTDQD